MELNSLVRTVECHDLILEMVETNDMQPNAGLEADKHERLNVILD